MYTFTRLLPAKHLVTRQLPALVVSLLIAEFLYRFGSFTLEAVAFLATWFAVDAVVTWIADRRQG